MQPVTDHTRLFGVLSPTKLFFRCAIPSMISMAFTSLYTIADGIFVGRLIGAGALAAVNLVMPLIMISFALADMIAVGSSVQISIRLGEGKKEEASSIFSFSCYMILFISFVTCAAGLLGGDALVGLLGATGEVARMASKYLKVYAAFSPVVMCFFAVDNYLRICGRVKYSMVMNVAVSIGNLVLDALFLAVFRWGIEAAALASCLCLGAGSLIGFFPFLAKKLPLRFVKRRLSLSQVGNIIANGSSEFFSNIASSLCMVMFNAVLMRLGGYIAVAAFSVVMYVDSVVKSMLFGMADSVQPALGYNYGAGELKRVFALERRVQAAALMLSVTAMGLMLLFGPRLASLFVAGDDQALMALSLRAMRLFSISYLVSWCGMVSSSFFTALNRPVFSLALSLCATLVFPILGLAFLPGVWGLDGVWLSSALSGVCSFALAGGLMIPVVRKLRSQFQSKRISPSGEGG